MVDAWIEEGKKIMVKKWVSDDINARINTIACKYNLDLGKLKSVILNRARGMSNYEVADLAGINRNTINKYVNALGEMEEREVYELLVLVGSLGLNCPIEVMD